MAWVKVGIVLFEAQSLHIDIPHGPQMPFKRDAEKPDDHQNQRRFGCFNAGLSYPMLKTGVKFLNMFMNMQA